MTIEHTKKDLTIREIKCIDALYPAPNSENMYFTDKGDEIRLERVARFGRLYVLRALDGVTFFQLLVEWNVARAAFFVKDFSYE